MTTTVLGWCGTIRHPTEAHERRRSCIAFMPEGNEPHDLRHYSAKALVDAVIVLTHKIHGSPEHGDRFRSMRSDVRAEIMRRLKP